MDSMTQSEDEEQSPCAACPSQGRLWAEVCRVPICREAGCARALRKAQV